MIIKLNCECNVISPLHHSRQLVQIYDIHQTHKPNTSYFNKFIDLLLLSINDWDTQLCSNLMDNV